MRTVIITLTAKHKVQNTEIVLKTQCDLAAFGALIVSLERDSWEIIKLVDHTALRIFS